MIKKGFCLLLALLLALTLSLSLVSCNGDPPAEGDGTKDDGTEDGGGESTPPNQGPALINYGTFGDSAVTWSLTEDGKLVIGGTGEMGNCITKANGSKDSDQPFGSYVDFIAKIEIAEGVTGLSEYTFKGCTAITEITLPTTLTHLPFECFAGCTSLKKVSAACVVTIDENAFAGCPALTSVTLSHTLEEVGLGAFFTGGGALSVLYYGTEAEWQALLTGGIHQMGNDVLKNATVAYDTQP